MGNRKMLKESYEMRVETESEAMALIEEERANQSGNPVFKTTYKTTTSKGEITDEWYVVTVTRQYAKK